MTNTIPETSAEMRDVIIAAIDAACVSRGKRKGMLKAQCPPSDTDAAAAWQAIMLEANPFKASIAARLFWTNRQHAIAREIEQALAANPMDRLKAREMDRDRVALERLRAW